MINLLLSLVACGEVAETPPPAATPPAAPAPPAAPGPSPKPPPKTAVGEALDVTTLPVDRWYRPYKQDGQVSVVVFWELWCPHCKREVPKLQALDQVEGVQIIGLTRQTKGVADADVEKFLADNGVTYAVGHTDDTLSKRLHIRSIPAAVVVDDGKIVWQGNPAGLTADKLREWL